MSRSTSSTSTSRTNCASSGAVDADSSPSANWSAGWTSTPTWPARRDYDPRRAQARSRAAAGHHPPPRRQAARTGVVKTRPPPRLQDVCGPPAGGGESLEARHRERAGQGPAGSGRQPNAAHCRRRVSARHRGRHDPHPLAPALQALDDRALSTSPRSAPAARARQPTPQRDPPGPARAPRRQAPSAGPGRQLRTQRVHAPAGHLPLGRAPRAGPHRSHVSRRAAPRPRPP